MRPILNCCLIVSIAACTLLTSCGTLPSTAKDSNRQEYSLFRAAERGSKAGVLQKLDRGIPIDATDDNGRTALHFAAERGHDSLVKLLVSKGARVNLQDDLGNTPLHYAAMNEHHDTMRALLAGGANTHIKNKNGQVPRVN